MQRRGAALYGLFFMLVVSGGYVLMAVNAGETVPVSESPEYTLQTGDTFSVNGQQYTLSQISVSQGNTNNLVRSATFQQVGSGNSINFGQSASIPMLIVRSGVPTSVSYTPSTRTVALGEQDYGAYYPNNNTVQLMASDVHSQAISATRSLNERFRGVWATVVLGTLAAILILGLSYLPRRE